MEDSGGHRGESSDGDTGLLTWLIGLLTSEQRIRLGEWLFPAGYHSYLCDCCDDSQDEAA